VSANSSSAAFEMPTERASHPPCDELFTTDRLLLSPAGKDQPRGQRDQVHRERGGDGPAGAGQSGGTDPLLGPGHRDRHSPGEAAVHLLGLRSGRRVHHTALWWHRAGAGHRHPAGPGAGWGAAGPERGGPGQHLLVQRDVRGHAAERRAPGAGRRPRAGRTAGAGGRRQRHQPPEV